MFDEKLNFREHIHCKINVAYKMVGLIKKNFKYLSISSFVLVCKNVVRSHLDYCNCVWNPYRKTDIETLEKVQKRATKILPKLRHSKYSDQLKKCRLPTLHYRRIRGAMIETYKIHTGKYNMVAVPNLSIATTVITRGNDLRLQKNCTRYDLRKFFSLTEWLICGIVFLIVLCMLNLLIYLRNG